MRRGDLSSGHAKAWAGRADALRMLGRYPEALEGYTRAVEFDPQLALAYRGRGDAHLGAREYALAIRDLRQALSLGFDGADA